MKEPARKISRSPSNIQPSFRNVAHYIILFSREYEVAAPKFHYSPRTAIRRQVLSLSLSLSLSFFLFSGNIAVAVLHIRPYKSIVIKRDERQGEVSWKPTLVCDMIDRCQFSGRITIRCDPPTVGVLLPISRLYKSIHTGRWAVKKPMNRMTLECESLHRRYGELTINRIRMEKTERILYYRLA